MNEKIGENPNADADSIYAWLDSGAESAQPAAQQPVDTEGPTDPLDTATDIVMGGLSTIGNHLRSEQLTARKAAQQEVKLQRRIWQLQEDAAVTGAPVPERAYLHPMGPRPKSRWGRIRHSLNTPA